MPSLISGPCFIKAATLRICCGLVFVGLSMAAYTAQSEEGSLASDLDILTIQPAHSGDDFLPPYQFSASVVLARLPDTTLTGLESGDAPQLFSAVKPQPETVNTVNAPRQQAYDGSRVSLPRLLRVEFKGNLANITFKPRMVLIEGEQVKITFRPQSTLIEKKQLKVMLQPHSVSMLWGKAF